MADTCALVPVNELCTRVSSGGTPSREHPEYFCASPNGHLWVKSKELLDGAIFETEERITDEGLQRSSAKCFTAGTLLVAMYGANAGQIAWLGKAAAFNQAICGLKIDEKKANRRYVYYSLLAGRRHLMILARGGAQQNLSQDIVASFPIRLIPRKGQDYIGDFLGAIDDLIANNTRRIALLESMARRMWREWFVEMLFPGSHERTAGDRLPQGWELKTVSSVTEFVNRGIAPEYDDDAPGLVINQKCIRNGSIDMKLARHQRRSFRDSLQVRVGDILVNSTGEGTLGRVAQVLDPVPNCTVDTHVTLVRPNREIGMHYLGLSLMRHESRLARMGLGATNQTELSRGQIGALPIVIPAQAIRERFENLVAPLFRQRSVLANTNFVLAQCRDRLLPVLFSGRISLPVIPQTEEVG